MPTDHYAALADIKTFPQLITYLRDEMGWPIARDSFEDVDDLFYDFTADELGIDPKTAAKITEIKRLKPLSTRQPWGIFFVKFEPRKLPVVALRRILSKVAMKKRASANSAERTAWAADDLLFVSSYGEGEERQISFAHFAKPQDGHDLSTLKVLGWDNLDTALHLDAVAKELTQHLVWPDDDTNVEAWRKNWRGAFTLRHGEVVTTSKELSLRLAKLAGDIRDRIKSTLAIETERGPLTKLMKAFQESLVHNLDAAGFADMYAQTIAYGLLSARIADPHKKTADDFAAHMRTNPFLRELMETFLHVGGRRGKAGGPGIDFDELGVSDVVELLDDANLEAVVMDFGDLKPEEDPVIHFYELFLKEYDEQQKVSRGVFYTPRPVVSYIVRSVDELLRNEFGLEDGLADTTTWGEMAKRCKDLKIPEGVPSKQVFVQILDPATGTGTFLVEVIDIIHKTMVAKWKAQGHKEKQVASLWNEYVPEHLLPRLHAYELLMAPYAIAHLKVGLKLYETGYRFGSDERARIYLTNALEPASDLGQQTLSGMFPALAHEAEAVNEVKEKQRFTVIIGNPPYSNFGQLNRNPFILNLLEDYKHGLKERKLNLDDDFIKFFRLGHHLLQQARAGVLGLITNNAYLEGITHRRMRELLIMDFAKVVVIDLHGNARKAEIDRVGGADKNVFDIMQGVAIGLFSTHRSSGPRVSVAHLRGDRQSKYDALVGKAVGAVVREEISPSSPYFMLVSRSGEDSQEYEAGVPLSEVFRVYQSPIQTKRDGLTIHFSEEELQMVLTDLRTKQQQSLRAKYNLAPDGRDWTLEAAIADVKNGNGVVIRIAYKPFDFRYTYFSGKTKGFLAYPRTAVMRHMLEAGARAFVFKRQGREDPCGYTYFFVTDCPFSEGLFAIDPRGREFIAPLELVEGEADNAHIQDIFQADGDANTPHHNFSPAFLKRLSAELDVPQSEGGLPKGISSAGIFHYLYAVVSSPAYRKRFAASLRVDFPRPPITRSMRLFLSLAKLGYDLVELHVGGGRTPKSAGCSWVGRGPIVVEKVIYDDGTVWLDSKRTHGCSGIPQVAWNYYVGGYQVCDKWLKQRKGRTLSQSDLNHFERIVAALVASHRVVGEIDTTIEKHGGWQAAFGAAKKDTATDS